MVVRGSSFQERPTMGKLERRFALFRAVERGMFVGDTPWFTMSRLWLEVTRGRA